jgi:hypothetical protein
LANDGIRDGGASCQAVGCGDIGCGIDGCGIDAWGDIIIGGTAFSGSTGICGRPGTP